MCNVIRHSGILKHLKQNGIVVYQDVMTGSRGGSLLSAAVDFKKDSLIADVPIKLTLTHSSLVDVDTLGFAIVSNDMDPNVVLSHYVALQYECKHPWFHFRIPLDRCTERDAGMEKCFSLLKQRYVCAPKESFLQAYNFVKRRALLVNGTLTLAPFADLIHSRSKGGNACLQKVMLQTKKNKHVNHAVLRLSASTDVKAGSPLVLGMDGISQKSFLAN